MNKYIVIIFLILSLAAAIPIMSTSFYTPNIPIVAAPFPHISLFHIYQDPINIILRWVNSTIFTKFHLQQLLWSASNTYAPIYMNAPSLPKSTVHAPGPPGIGSGDLYPIITYISPTIASLLGGGYEYTTSFGLYDIQPILGNRDYSIAYRSSDMAFGSNITRAGFVIQEDSGGPWVLLVGVSTTPTVTSTTTSFKSVWTVTKNSLTIGTATLNIVFSRNAAPEVTVNFTKTANWAGQGMKDFRWVWVIIPSVGYDTFTYQLPNPVNCTPALDAQGNQLYDSNGNPEFLYATYQQCTGYIDPIHTYTITQLAQGNDNVTVGQFSRAQFTGAKNWHTDWTQEGAKSVVLIKSNQLTGDPAIAIIFTTNQSTVDPSIANDTSCTASGSGTGSTGITCNLVHAANVFIYVAVMLNDSVTNSGTVSGVTVGGFTALSGNGPNGSTSSVEAYDWLFYSPYSATDAILAKFSGDTNNAEAMVAASFTGTRNTLPFLNSGANQALASSTSTSVATSAGETNRRLINTVFTATNASITKGASQTEIAQVNNTGSNNNASIELNYQDAGAATTLTSSWSGAANHFAYAHAILPATQIITDSNGSFTTSVGTGNINASTSGTIATIGHNANSVCVVVVGLLDTSSQTVSSVVGATSGAFIQLTTVTNGTSVSVDVWYIYDTGTATGTITVSTSASVSGDMDAACFANAKGVQLFEGKVAATGTSGTASVTVNAGTANRRILLGDAFAAAVSPAGSQGVDLEATNANSIGVNLNYLDASSQQTMSATDSSVAWAAIGVALLPFPITQDSTASSSCSATSASSATTTCTISYAANTLITVFAGNAGADTVSSLTVNGNTATQVATKTQTTIASVALFYYYSTTSASGVSVTANWSSHNTNESIAAVSWVGTRSSAPFFNSQTSIGAATATTDNTTSPPSGEINRTLIKGLETSAANTFVPTQNANNPAFDLLQVSGNSNSFDVMANNSASKPSNFKATWGTSANYANLVVAILPPKQVVVDGNTTTGTSGATNVSCSNNVASSATVTCALPSHDANVLVVVVPVLVNAASQTVSSVKIGSQAFTQLTTIANGTSVSTDVWWWNDTNSGAETITVTPSANAAMGVLAVAFANFPTTCNTTAANCFDVVGVSGQPYVTGTGNSATASSGSLASGVANRRMFLAVGEGANAAITGSQGADIIAANSASSVLSEDANAFEQASSTAYTLKATFTSNPWAVIGAAILDAISYDVSFAVAGFGSDASQTATVIAINSINYDIPQLVYKQSYNSGTSVTYAYSSPICRATFGGFHYINGISVCSIVDINGVNIQYAWSSTSGCSQTTQTGTITVSSSCTLTATYITGWATFTLIFIGGITSIVSLIYVLYYWIKRHIRVGKYKS